MKRFLSYLLFSVCLMGTIAPTVNMFVTDVYCDEEETVKPSSGQSIGDLLDTTTQTLDSSVVGLKKFAIAVFTVVGLLGFIMLMFSRDSRKTGAIVGWLFTGAVGLAGVIVVSSGWANGAIENIVTKFFPG